MKNMVKFMNGIYSFSRDSGKVGKGYKTVGRFYNPFARLNKEIRKISKQLFEMEGFMIVDVLAKELTKEYRREIPVFTIHDSTATTSDHIEAVKNRFDEIFYRNYE